MSAAPEGARPLAVFDIDGVLADVSHRLHYLDVHRWETFFAAAHADPLLEEGAERLRAAQAEYDVVYLTRRPERNRRLTETWLRSFGLPTGPLFMRPTTTTAPPATSSARSCGCSPASGRSR